MEQKLALLGTNIAEAYLFGSCLNPEQHFRDVDMVVVSLARAGTANWKTVRSFCATLADDFSSTFGVPLSIMIVTQSEWLEVDGSIVRERLKLA